MAGEVTGLNTNVSVTLPAEFQDFSGTPAEVMKKSAEFQMYMFGINTASANNSKAVDTVDKVVDRNAQ